MLPYIGLYHLRRLRQIRQRVRLVLAVVISRLDYCNSVLAGTPLTTTAPLQRVQNAEACLILEVRLTVLCNSTYVRYIVYHFASEFSANYMYALLCPLYLQMSGLSKMHCTICVHHRHVFWSPVLNIILSWLRCAAHLDTAKCSCS